MEAQRQQEMAAGYGYHDGQPMYGYPAGGPYQQGYGGGMGGGGMGGGGMGGQRGRMGSHFLVCWDWCSDG